MYLTKVSTSVIDEVTICKGFFSIVDYDVRMRAIIALCHMLPTTKKRGPWKSSGSIEERLIVFNKVGK